MSPNPVFIVIKNFRFKYLPAAMANPAATLFRIALSFVKHRLALKQTIAPTPNNTPNNTMALVASKVSAKIRQGK